LVGQERLAVQHAYATGELAALSADLEAAGTTNRDDTAPGPPLTMWVKAFRTGRRDQAGGALKKAVESGRQR
jgi:hypothetical protein